MSKKKILFLCTHNSCRSQMAEGLANYFFSEKLYAQSAGSEPEYVHPLAIKVMKELGIDISSQRSKSVMEFFGQEFDYVITLCELEPGKGSCPAFIGRVGQLLTWKFPDPASAGGSEEQRLKVFRQVRDAIKEKLEKWINGDYSLSDTSTDALVFSPVESEPEE